MLSNDVDKKRVWEDTIAWAAMNGCLKLVENIPDEGFCFLLGKPSSYTVGPTGKPMYGPWNFDAKPRPSPEDLERHLTLLQPLWAEIAGPALFQATRPVSLTGRKGRRLFVRASPSVRPPWGDWNHRSTREAARRTFTRFRTAINRAISPHEVDHVDFAIGNDAGHRVARDAPPKAHPEARR